MDKILCFISALIVIIITSDGGRSVPVYRVASSSCNCWQLVRPWKVSSTFFFVCLLMALFSPLFFFGGGGGGGDFFVVVGFCVD